MEITSYNANNSDIKVGNFLPPKHIETNGDYSVANECLVRGVVYNELIY